ncbi:olfactory receptor 14I1-like [Tachyglossus aculeatus]|uniref:olfactory receptor 14I1-like n=1 Tax=Tachyglossus aculeatus TaxID=9261 RepID=UPI0018F6336A|nr:olfactory receptor 14I1-like [Tachyglossus aculeatus]
MAIYYDHYTTNCCPLRYEVFMFFCDVPSLLKISCSELHANLDLTLNNHTSVTRFLLLGFLEVRELQLVHATLFLLAYLVALTGNLLIIAITAFDQRLHSPMYFFLRHLSVLDLCLISVTVPKSILNSLTNSRSISFVGCTTPLRSHLLPLAL